MFAATTPSVESRLTIHRLSPGESKVFLVLSNSVTAINTHWTQRTRLCVGQERCPACFIGLQPRWIGFVPVQTAAGVPGLLEITASSGHHWLGDLEGQEVYGMVIEVTRKSQHSGIMAVRSERYKRALPMAWSGEEVFDAIARILQLPRRRNYLDADLWRNGIETAAIGQLNLDLGIKATAGN